MFCWSPVLLTIVFWYDEIPCTETTALHCHPEASLLRIRRAAISKNIVRVGLSRSEVRAFNGAC